MNSENFYILLELSVTPPEDDKNKIEAAIAKKQAEWSKMRSHPTKGIKAQLYLGMLPQIKTLMADPDKRREEAKKARILEAEKEKEKFKQLDSAIGILSSKGHITRDEVEKLTKKLSLPEEVIRKRIKVPIKEIVKVQKEERLEPSVAKKISDSLAVIREESLYGFLKISPTSELSTLQARSNEKDVELKKNSHKDAILTAGMELVGHCMTVFKTETMRRKYDAGRAYQRLAELNEAIDFAGMNGEVGIEEYDKLMTKAREMGLKFEAAEEHISDYCRRKKWSLRIPRRTTAEDMKQCGYCGCMNQPGTKNCSNCGAPLEIACPKCKEISPATFKNCGKCGFTIGDMLNALPLLKSAKEVKAGGDIKKTADLLRKALLYWPDHPEALPMLREIEAGEKEIAQLAEKLNHLVNEGKYYNARQVLFKLKQIDAAHPQLSMETKITAQIKAAETWVKKANSAASGDDALDLFGRALQQSKDCREALEGMAKYPPDPPGRLEALPSPRSIALEWNKSGSRGTISYRIARKAQSPPLNAQDGEELGETAQTMFDETGAVPGIIYYYGIYTKRGGVYSKSGAIAGPVMRTAEIKDLSVTPGDSQINLAWKAPENAAEILVLVKPGIIPSGRNDGQSLQGVRGDGAVATGLKNDQTYGILILTTYKNEKGKPVYSAGTTCRARPVAPPPPVEDMTAARNGNKINIKWTPPQRGAVQLFQSREPFSHAPGDIISAAALTGTGTQIPVHNPGGTQLIIDFQGIVHILPISVVGDMAVVGKPGSITSIDEVTHLKGEINSGKLYLEWQWPAGAQKVCILYNNRQFPAAPDDPGSVKKVFTRVEYLKNSGYVIRSVEPQDYYFTIFVMAGEGEKTLYSTGTPYMVNNTGHMELYYEILLTKNFLGKVKAAELKLFSKEKAFKIPEALLVKKRHNLPLRKADGMPILEIKPMMINSSARTIDINPVEISKGNYVRLFFKEDAHHQRFRVMSPSKDKLQLG